MTNQAINRNIDEIDAEIDALFEGAVMVSTPRAFKALNIGNTFGHELINRGVLVRHKIGRASRTTVASIKRAAKNGVPGKATSAGPKFRRGN